MDKEKELKRIKELNNHSLLAQTILRASSKDIFTLDNLMTELRERLSEWLKDK